VTARSGFLFAHWIPFARCVIRAGTPVGAEQLSVEVDRFIREVRAG